VEEAPVQFPDPASPLLHKPNEITARDFDGWIQERGLYFASKWDDHYQPLFETHDPGQKPQTGSTLYTRMRPLDWVVLFCWLVFIVSYGLYRGRGSNTVNKYLLAGKSMPWYAMALSIMATQASAITFISTTGQSYTDGMRFVQFYFGMPLAMVILCATAVPIFHRANVYTAYEYLEKRFDAKTRALASVIFLMQRGLAVGLTFYAPAIVLSIIFGWPDRADHASIIGVTGDDCTRFRRHQSTSPGPTCSR
jgi:hypothetical protein